MLKITPLNIKNECEYLINFSSKLILSRLMDRSIVIKNKIIVTTKYGKDDGSESSVAFPIEYDLYKMKILSIVKIE